MDDMTLAEKASFFRREGFNCSQSVLAAFCGEFDFRQDAALKLATAFGAGMARQQRTCGAVTGAMMVLGLRYGMGLHDPSEYKNVTYAKTIAFFEEFSKRNGSVKCRDLLDGLDMQNPEDYRMMVEKEMFTTRCDKYVQDAVDILGRLLEGSQPL